MDTSRAGMHRRTGRYFHEYSHSSGSAPQRRSSHSLSLRGSSESRSRRSDAGSRMARCTGTSSADSSESIWRSSANGCLWRSRRSSERIRNWGHRRFSVIGSPRGRRSTADAAGDDDGWAVAMAIDVLGARRVWGLCSSAALSPRKSTVHRRGLALSPCVKFAWVSVGKAALRAHAQRRAYQLRSGRSARPWRVETRSAPRRERQDHR